MSSKEKTFKVGILANFHVDPTSFILKASTFQKTFFVRKIYYIFVSSRFMSILSNFIFLLNFEVPITKLISIVVPKMSIFISRQTAGVSSMFHQEQRNSSQPTRFAVPDDGSNPKHVGHSPRLPGNKFIIKRQRRILRIK